MTTISFFPPNLGTPPQLCITIKPAPKNKGRAWRLLLIRIAAAVSQGRAALQV